MIVLFKRREPELLHQALFKSFPAIYTLPRVPLPARTHILYQFTWHLTSTPILCLLIWNFNCCNGMKMPSLSLHRFQANIFISSCSVSIPILYSTFNMFLQKLFPNQYNFWLVVFVALGTIATAYGLSIIGSTVGQPSFYTYFNLPQQGEPGYGHTVNMIAALNGVNSGGAFVGCLIHAWASEKYGWKRTMQLGCIILIIGGALCGGSVHLGMLIFGRTIAGLGSGILACVVPMYQAEISTPETRGAMVCVTGISYGLGNGLAGWIGFACFHMSPESPAASFAWRFPLSFQVLFPLVVLVGSSPVPFSPRWLLFQGRRQEALDIVRRLHRTPDDVDDIKGRTEFYLMDKQCEMEKAIKVRPFEIFRTPTNRRRALVSFLVMWGNQARDHLPVPTPFSYSPR